MTRDFQDTFLHRLMAESMSVTLHLSSGFQIRGKVHGFDNYVIIVESEGKLQMVYKHAVSTVVPQRALKMETEDESESD